MFMMKAPEFDASPLPSEQAEDVMRAFARGTADKFPARTLVRAGIVKHHALRGGIFWRREPIKYIVMHSTETGVPVSGVRVIESWSSMGRRHPGAQYVVDRDGTIYQAVDPDLATVHINILKTLPGINNDNSVGIEMNHTGSQNYPEVQLQAVIRLVTYLQDRYQVESENIITHRYAQQGDHTDPVHFDWKGFLWSKDRHRNEALAYKMNSMERQSGTWGDYTAPPAVPVNVPAAVPAAVPGPDQVPAVIIQTQKSVQAEQVIKQSEQPLNVVPPVPPANVPPAKQIKGVPYTPAPTDPGRVPEPETDGSEREPTRSEVVPHSPSRLPDLRGPIEVGPEHASDVHAPEYPTP